MQSADAAKHPHIKSKLPHKAEEIMNLFAKLEVSCGARRSFFVFSKIL